MLLYFGFFVSILLSTFQSLQAQTTSDSMIPCNVFEPDHCPIDHCCVHDEYLFPLTYCKPFGKLGEPCVIKPSSFECHCAPGLKCISNIHGHHESLFGICKTHDDRTLSSTKRYDDLVG